MKRLALLLLLPALAHAAVYAPGLAQAKFTGASTDKTSDIASSSTLTYAAGLFTGIGLGGYYGKEEQ